MFVDCPVCSGSFALASAPMGAAARDARCPRCASLLRPMPGGDITVIDRRPRVDEPRLDPHRPRLATVRDRDVIDAAERPARRARPPRARGVAAPIALLGLGLVLAVGLFARQTLTRLWPGAGPAYAALGLATAPRGLAIQELTSEIARQGDADILIVTGTVRNLGSLSREVPPLRVGIADARAIELYGWTVDVPRASLEPGEAAPFRARLAAPPESGRDVSVRFIQPPTIAAAPTRFPRSP